MISGEGILCTFPAGVSELEYYEECCDCGSVHKVTMLVDWENKTVTLRWFTVCKGNKNDRNRAARQRRLQKISKNRVITSGMYRLTP